MIQGAHWTAAGHAVEGSSLSPAAWTLIVLLGSGLAFLLLRAVRRRRWYRAEHVLSEVDLERLHAALAAAERRTLGEILPVVVERSDRYPEADGLAALATALAGSLALAPWLPWDRPWLLVAAQLGLGALGTLLARLLPDFRRLFVSEARATELAEEQAFQEFHRFELHRTDARTGVLLFVSLLERRAIVLADEGIHARVGPEPWQATNEAVLAGIRRGSLAAGLLAGIESTGAVLAQHFPPAAGDRNEVPDRIVVRRE